MTYPDLSNDVHHEIEMVVAISQSGANIPADKAHALIYDGCVKTHDPSWQERMEAKVRRTIAAVLRVMPIVMSYFFAIAATVVVSVATGYYAAYLLSHLVFYWGG